MGRWIPCPFLPHRALSTSPACPVSRQIGFLLPTRHTHTLAYRQASCLPFFFFFLSLLNLPPLLILRTHSHWIPGNGWCNFATKSPSNALVYSLYSSSPQVSFTAGSGYTERDQAKPTWDSPGIKELSSPTVGSQPSRGSGTLGSGLKAPDLSLHSPLRMMGALPWSLTPRLTSQWASPACHFLPQSQSWVQAQLTCSMFAPFLGIVDSEIRVRGYISIVPRAIFVI